MKQIVPVGRVVGLDVARCLALLGMMATHVLAANAPDGSVTLVQQVAGGRASALFAVLAGVSMAYMSGRATPPEGRERAATSAGLAVRALVIALIGLVLGAFDSGIAVILTYYGLLFLLGIPFIGLRSRALFLLGGAWLVAVPALSHVIRPHLPGRGYSSPTLGMLADPGRLLSELAFTGYYPVVPWLAYLLVGMAIGRLDLSSRRLPMLLAGAGAVLATLSWVASAYLVSRPGVLATLERTYTGPQPPGGIEDWLVHGLYGSTPTGSWWWLAVRAPHTASPFDLAHTIGCALAVIGVCVLVSRLAPQAAAVLFGAGAMTLTLYSTHVVLRATAWPGDDLETYLRHVVFAVGVGALFRLRGLRGPLEALVTWLARATSRQVRPRSGTSVRT